MPKFEKSVRGFFCPETMSHLVPIPNLLAATTIESILDDADRALSVINSEFVELVDEYRGPDTTAMGLDPHDALLRILALDRPLDPIVKMLKAVGKARPEDSPVFHRKEALSHVCAQTALRRGTLAEMPLSALVSDGGVFVLRIEARLFKNRRAARFTHGRCTRRLWLLRRA
jgi:hypothetical protein